MGINALQFGYVHSEAPGMTDFRLTAERCILCGACAANCPTGALTLADRDGERILSLCGTVLCHEKLEYCDQCGTVVGPARYLDYVKKRTSAIIEAFEGRQLCEKCARQRTAGYKSGITIP
jgi:ferredoxin